MHATNFPSTPHIDTNDDVLPSEVDVLCAGDRPAEPVEWLWPGRIPIGKVTLLVGDPGHGKSLVALDVAARVSRGADWPDQSKAEGGRGKAEGCPPDDATSCDPPPSPLPLPPSSVLVLSAEDDLADTIRSRLDAAGADPERVFVLPSLVDLRNEFAELRAAVDRLRGCRLIVIDPINAYVGPADSHFHTVVRRVLAPLAELSTEKRLAVLALTNLRKSIGMAIYRTAGSMGFVSLARAVWTVCRDQADTDRRLFLPLKNNLAAAACGFAFTIEPRGPLAAPAVAWDPKPVTTNADKIVGPAAKPPGPEALERQAAGEWLRSALADGPRSAWDLSEEALEHGFTQRTLRRALHAIGGQTRKGDYFGGWLWSLPNDGAPEDDQPHPKQPGPFAATWPLGGIGNDQFDAETLAASMAALDRSQRRRGADSPGADKNSDHQPSPPDEPLRNVIDRLLQSFGEASRAKVKCPQRANADASKPSTNRSGAIL